MTAASETLKETPVAWILTSNCKNCCHLASVRASLLKHIPPLQELMEFTCIDFRPLRDASGQF